MNSDAVACYASSSVTVRTALVPAPGLAHADVMSGAARKPVFGVSNQVRHKPDCTATEDGQRLEISNLGSREIVLSVERKERR